MGTGMNEWDGEDRRAPTVFRLAAEDIDEIVSRLGHSQHAQHHEWIAAEIQRERERTEFWADLRKHVAKWGAVSVLTLAGYLLWRGFKNYVALP